jgi:hypothetical protein
MTDLMTTDELSDLCISATEMEGPQQSLLEILGEEPMRLIGVGRPSLEPLSLQTYQVRLARALAGEGPCTYGLAEFVATLASLAEPASAVVVAGQISSYVLLLDSARSRIVAWTAVDPPIENRA